MANILIVDDDEQNLYLLESLLKGHGQAVVTARNGAKALEAARRSPPELIISDVLMPVMDGFCLVREWKRDPALRHVPFIVYTATYTDPKDEQLALDLGADLFLIKPQEPDTLVEVIRRSLAQSWSGQLTARQPPPVPEAVQLKEYNAALVRKLESKLIELEESHKALDASRQQLFQAQKMEAIGRMANGVAHDVNNFLGVVAGHTELILNEPALGGDVRDSVELIAQAVRQGTMLTRQLMLLSRKSGVVLEPVQVDEAVRAMLPVIRSAAGRGVEVIVRPAAEPAWVRLGSGQLEQVLLNLALNARDAMDGQGRLTIETTTSGQWVRLVVGDTGAGMTPEVLAHLFEPFFTTKEEGKGTGLGLAVVYGIVKQGGGEVSVVSEPGRGATFSLDFPRLAR